MNNKYVNDFDNTVKKYLNDIGDAKYLSADEEIKILRRIKKGDEEAKQILIKANLKFVVSVAKEFKGYGIPFHDLISEGNIGLIKAIDKFKLSKNNRFITYARWWVKQSIQASIKSTLITSSLDDSTNQFNIDEEDMNESDDMESNDIYNMHPSFIQDIEEDEDIEKNNNEIVENLLTSLNKREQDIINMYYGLCGEEYTLEEIGCKLNLTKVRINQIKDKALTKLRSHALVMTSLNDKIINLKKWEY